jgi:hypothetical protein
MEITGIGYVGFESPNSDVMKEMGPKVWGFGLDESRDDGITYLKMDDAFFRVAVHPGPDNKLNYIGFEVRTQPLWEQAVETLRSVGVEIVMGSDELCHQRGVSGLAQFRDPAGWPLELFWGQWFKARSWLPGRPHGGFYQSERFGVGHLILRSFNREDCDTFVEKVMGFRPYRGHGNWHWSSGYRAKLNDITHNYGYQGDPNHRYGDTHTEGWGCHIGIYNNEFVDVAIAYDLATQLELPGSSRGLMSPSFDPAIAFEVETPAGFGIQYHSPPVLAPDATYIERVPHPDHQLIFGYANSASVRARPVPLGDR